MPYNNEYNRNLARQTNVADRNYADINAYSKTDGLTGGIRFNSGNASKRVDSEGYYEVPHIPDVYYEGEGLMEGGHHPDDENEDYCIKGGSGFASGSYMDTGYDSVKGAGGSGGTKMKLMPVVRDVEGCGQSGGRRRGRPSKMAGAGVFDGAKRLASKAYNAGKYAYDKGKVVYDYGKRLYNKPISTGLELASKGADYMGYGRRKKGAGVLPASVDNMFNGVKNAMNYQMSPDQFSNYNEFMDYMPKGKKKGSGAVSSGLKMAGMISGNPVLSAGGALAGMFGLGKNGKGKKKLLKGEGFFDDVGDTLKTRYGFGKKKEMKGGFNMGGLARLVGDVFGGKKNQKKGGTLLGTAETQNVSGGRKKGKGAVSSGLKMAGMLSGNPVLSAGGALAGMFGLGKNGKKKGGALVPVAQMQSIKGAGGSGGKKPNKRAEIVRKVMKEKGCSMIEASKFVKANNLY